MTGLTLLFAAHMLSLLLALGAAIVLAGESGRSRLTRLLGALGFLVLAGAEAFHGAGYSPDDGGTTLWLRSAGYVLVLAAAIPPVRVPGALVAFPLGPVAPGVLAVAAGLTQGWRRLRERGGVWLGLGLVMLGAADALFASSATWAPAAAHGLRVAGWLTIGAFALTLRRHSIRFRVVTGFVALLLAVVLAVSSGVTQVIADNLRDSAVGAVQVQAQRAAEGFAPQAQGAAGNVVASAQAIPPEDFAGQPGDLDTSAEALLEIFRTSEIDFIVLLDRGGVVLGTAGVSEATAFEIAGSPIVGDVVAAGGETASPDTLPSGRLAVLGAAPVEDEVTRAVVGVAVVGLLVDRAFLTDLLPPGTPAAVFRAADPIPVASTFPGWSPGTPLLSTERIQRLRERALGAGPPEVESLRILGEDYFSAAVGIKREPDTPVATLLVAEPASVLAETQEGVTRVIFLIALGAAALALLLAFFVARRITRPVVALTEAARGVQAGDLDVHAEARGEDEVADLARAFNQMTESVTDMTGELRNAADEQGRLRARLETVLNSMGDGLIAVGDDGRVVIYNPAAGAILGLPRSRVVGKQLRDVLKGRTADGRALHSPRGSPNGLAFVRRIDGVDVPVAVTSTPLRDGTGTAVGRVYLLRDMTREHQVERMKTEFLSNVSHELRTPLTPIIGYSELLARRGGRPEQAREFASGILESARRLERVVGMLVDFSAMEGGRMALSTEPVQLGPIVREIVQGWRDRSDAHRFIARIPRDLPPALVDVTLLRRILDELLDNAVKYSPNGGRVRVEVSGEGPARERMLRVAVTDQGIGIEPEDLARIFQDFRQLDASDTRMFGGLGLGLAFVKRIVEAHGGAVEASSEPGGGSSFTFTVPAADGKGRRKRSR